MVTECFFVIAAQPDLVAESPLQQPRAPQQPHALQQPVISWWPSVAWQQAEAAPQHPAILRQAVVVLVGSAEVAGHREKAGQPIAAPRAGTAGCGDEAGPGAAGLWVAAGHLFNSAREHGLSPYLCSPTVCSTTITSWCGVVPWLCKMVGQLAGISSLPGAMVWSWAATG